jgi:MFS family permease
MIEQTYKNRKRWIVLGILCLSLFIIAIDNMVLNFALPSISRCLGASGSQLQWNTDAYILVFASLLLPMGAIGDRYGRKRILQIGTLLFGIGSLAAALSTSTEMLITFRAFLGLGGRNDHAFNTVDSYRYFPRTPGKGKGDHHVGCNVFP